MVIQSQVYIQATRANASVPAEGGERVKVGEEPSGTKPASHSSTYSPPTIRVTSACLSAMGIQVFGMQTLLSQKQPDDGDWRATYTL